jgi:uncharacterized protein YdhG (YjbR/CyaY superfamily)
MPVYDIGGRQLCLFASQKHYVSLYLDPEVVEKYRGELERLSLGKSCARFRNPRMLHLETVEAMLREVIQRGEEGHGSD